MYASVLFFVTVSCACSTAHGLSERSFTIDYKNNCFLKDGHPFQYISGSIHYSRIPRFYWKDRLLKMYMAGLDAIQIYVPWNFHETVEGIHNFTGDRDLEHFLDLANQTDLLVILRPGPYICAEWEMIDSSQSVTITKLQTNAKTSSLSDPTSATKAGFFSYRVGCQHGYSKETTLDYALLIQAVTNWFAVLLPKMTPWLYANGGNIISVQVENEYGSYYACDHNYMRHLRTVLQVYLGKGTVLFTTDGNTDKEMTCGTLEGLYATVDFGTGDNITEAFNRQRRFEPRGPLVNSEYYTGWLDHWGDEHAMVDTQKVSRGLAEMLNMGANINMYMFEGGTNFGYWNGADHDTKFRPVVTSYDYDAPLSEAGDPTEKLLAIRDVIKTFKAIPFGPMPPATPKFAYGFVMLTKVGNISSLLDTFSVGPVQSKYPLTFEELKQFYGFVLYQTTLPRDLTKPTLLISPLNGIRDRAYVSVNGVFQGLLERDTILVMNITGRQGDIMDILVENMGRVNFGSHINDYKGVIGNLILGQDVLTDWKMYPLDIDGAIAAGWPHTLRLHEETNRPSIGPTFYMGTLQPSGVAWDTFLKLNEWKKGQVWINGVNLGRYWPARGPQQTLYVPGPLLSTTLPNNITVLELEEAPVHLRLLFMDRPLLKVADKS